MGETNNVSSKTVSYSEVSSYMECPRKHYYAYIERLHKVKYSQSVRINIGLVVHSLIQASLLYYIDLDYNVTIEQLEKMIDTTSQTYIINAPKMRMYMDTDGNVKEDLDDLQEYYDNIKLAVQITKRLMRHLDVPRNWRTEFITWDGQEVPLVEFKFEYPIVEDNNIVGKIDWVARSLFDNQVYLIDWKTRAKFTDDFKISGEDMNLQLSIYQYVLNSLGVKTFGTVTYQIRSDIPHEPEITKKEKVSESRMATDWETYSNALIRNGQNPDEHLDMKDKIEDRYGDDYWWLPIYIIRGGKELQNRWLTTQQITDTMLKDINHSKYETPRCIFCPYYHLCLGEDRGMDVEYTKQLEYTKDEGRH